MTGRLFDFKREEWSLDHRCVGRVAGRAQTSPLWKAS